MAIPIEFVKFEFVGSALYLSKIQCVEKPWALPKPTNFFEKKFDKKLYKTAQMRGF